ncbi:hypothetical protein EDF60_1676 [Leucobacter luti]|uniref:hypothetical protein n=1 Tax=Leucobacter luti TaxID=340320 RepID=UPI00104BA377|nr:hypothetical protein [Leucobacter luti]MCW2287025.1 hypothetical protein [Leucobacter luti]TCK41250.1 hypothetical protein EDF60_1676 [Leucobacter luti]
MTEGRSYRAQLATARMILAQGEQQLTEHATTGAHADRIDGLHKLKATWTARIAQLEPLARNEATREQGKGTAFGL